MNGFLCDVRSTESLLTCLEKIVEMSHDKRLDMGRKSRLKIENEFAEDIVINKYLNAIEQCLKMNG